MFPHFINLLGRSWDALVKATSTNTLGFALWTLGVAIVGWCAAVANQWFKHWRARDSQPFRKAVVGSLTTGISMLVGIAVLVTIAYGWFVVRTVYDDHQHLVALSGQLAESNKALSAEVQWRKHNIATTDPVFPNLIYLLQAFDIYRHALNGQRCAIVLTAPRESEALARVVASFSNSVSNCTTSGPDDASRNPDVETETMVGMVPDFVVFHAARDDKAANQLFNELGNQIQLKRSYELPPVKNYAIPPGVGQVHVVWLQFGTDSKWNSELYNPAKSSSSLQDPATPTADTSAPTIPAKRKEFPLTFAQYFFLALVPLLVPSLVWLFKLWLVERYVFIYGKDDTLKHNPYVIVRLDKLTGRVHGFNWAGWVQVKPHSGYPGTTTPQDS